MSGQAPTMNDSIKQYDRLHSCGRDDALTIEQANAEGCKFYDNEATRQAFADFRECFRSFCEEQNSIEGEPFAQESPSIRQFLDLHKATKRPSRRLKIGVKAPPVISIGRQSGTFQQSSAPPAPRSLRVEEKPSATATILEAPVAAVEKMSVTNDSFEAFVRSTSNGLFADAVFFLPKDNEADFLKNKSEYAKRHGFRGKQETLDKLVRFRSVMRAGNWSEANNIEIVSLTGRTHKVADITFNFSSLDDCLADSSQIPIVKMVSSAPLKR